MITRPLFWGGVLAVCALAAEGGSAAATTGSAVLRGMVLAAPAAPVCMPRVPCMRPAAGVVLAFSRGGMVRARVTTAADGNYLVTLARGTYGVRVTRPEGVRRLNPSSVTLSAGERRRLTFYLDTGIR